MNTLISEEERNLFYEKWHPQLVEFKQHRQTLLDILHEARSPTAGPFDKNKVWQEITRLASLYLSAMDMQRAVIPSAERLNRLRVLKKALSRARIEADKALQDDIGSDLFRAWAAGAGITPASLLDTPDVGKALPRIVDDIRKVVRDLATLETAAGKAAQEVRAKRGRPKGTSVLDLEAIAGLANLYLSSTGKKPGAGEGPFARLVDQFLIALKRRTAPSSILEAIKAARRKTLQNPSGWGPSPFR